MTKLRPWVVAGAAGFLASHVVEQLLARNIPVIGVDDLSWNRQDYAAESGRNSGISLFISDIRNTAGLTDLLNLTQPEAVLHLAALRRGLVDVLVEEGLAK